jgi:hypothetical protein
MSASSKGDPDLATLRDDIATLKRDVTNLMEHLKATATGTAQGAAAQLDEGARQLCHNLAAEAERRAKALGRQVEEQPLMSLLIALGVGYIGGRFLSR